MVDEYFPMTSFSIYNNHYHPDFTWKIEGIREMTERRENLATESPETFVWYGYPRVAARVKLSIEAKTGHVHVGLHLFCPDDEDGSRAAIKSIPTVYYVLRDRCSSSETKAHAVRPVYSELSTNFDYSSCTFKVLFCHKEDLVSALFNADDSVVLDVVVETPAMTRRALTTDGTLDWTVGLLRKRREAQREAFVGYQESPYFFTAEKGFRVQAYLSLVEGDGEGVRVGVVYLCGEYDDDQHQHYSRQQITVTLKGPTGSECLTWVMNADVKAKTRHEVLIRGALFDRCVENDSVTIQFAITPLPIKP